MFLVGQYDFPSSAASRWRSGDIPFLHEPRVRALHRKMRAQKITQKITWRALDKPNPRIMTLKHSNPVGSERQVKPPRCQI